MTTTKPKAEFDEYSAAVEYEKRDPDVHDFIHGARYQFEKDQQRIERLEREIVQLKEANLFTANEIERINTEVHGDLYGDDEMPELWQELEKLKYHCLGSDIGAEEALQGTDTIVKTLKRGNII